MTAMRAYDVVIIGSGVGGGAVARQLAGTGARVLILERGPVLPREPQNWDPESVFVDLRYRSTETWTNGDRKFRPGQYYFVGGHTKFYGTAMFRFRERDFEAHDLEDGITPAWPIGYGDLEPWYAQAEQLFGVRGQAGIDPTEPPRSAPYAHDPIPHEPVLAQIAARLKAQGLKPFPMPSAVDYGGLCRRCGTCDAFPCQIDAKGDAEMCLVRPALRQPNVELRTEIMVERLITDDTGRRIVAADVNERGVKTRIHASLFVLSAGAVNSAALLLRSADARNPQGLANSSDVVGRHFMNHNCTGLMALHPTKRNDTKFPKTLSLNDYYFGDADRKGEGPPLGNLQLLGKLSEPILRGAMPAWTPRRLRQWVAEHSVDWYVMSEDLPHRDSTVRLNSDGSIDLRWHRTNMNAHRQWVRKAARIIRRTGYPIVLTKPFTMDTPSHQCGTVRFGNDPATSALDPFCKAWDHDNLYVVDASFFPSSAAVNPALTIAAQALRVGHHLRTEVLQ
ncbi:GMC family oxidoreductase [Variovorax sp. J22R133]|uniref:GMC oxidoreductase n=1 Tax=Variovorax brevis TaxID=3053503 RepID=UPI0025771B1C|nr:GMC family oxidoreductase [Variovorax sp. J22R133]MDM0111223.1 GMC family oxidoreductase [Variovorax sp. J22R133]